MLPRPDGPGSLGPWPAVHLAARALPAGTLLGIRVHAREGTLALPPSHDRSLSEVGTALGPWPRTFRLFIRYNPQADFVTEIHLYGYSLFCQNWDSQLKTRYFPIGLQRVCAHPTSCHFSVGKASISVIYAFLSLLIRNVRIRRPCAAPLGTATAPVSGTFPLEMHPKLSLLCRLSRVLKACTAVVVLLASSGSGAHAHFLTNFRWKSAIKCALFLPLGCLLP